MPKGFPKNGLNKGWFKKGRENSKEFLDFCRENYKGKGNPFYGWF